MFETQIWAWPVTTLNPIRTDMYMFMAEQELPGRGKRAPRERWSRSATPTWPASRLPSARTDPQRGHAGVRGPRRWLETIAMMYERQAPVLQDMAEAATLRYAAGQAGSTTRSRHWWS